MMDDQNDLARPEPEIDPNQFEARPARREAGDTAGLRGGNFASGGRGRGEIGDAPLRAVQSRAAQRAPQNSRASQRATPPGEGRWRRQNGTDDDHEWAELGVRRQSNEFKNDIGSSSSSNFDHSTKRFSVHPQLNTMEDDQL